jgi:hypothetical protein
MNFVVSRGSHIHPTELLVIKVCITIYGASVVPTEIRSISILYRPMNELRGVEEEI